MPNKYQKINRDNLIERHRKSVTLAYALLNQTEKINKGVQWILIFPQEKMP